MSEPVKKKRKRGEGSIYRRGRIWWIRYYANGHSFGESAKTENETEAANLLDRRLKEARSGDVVDTKRQLILYVMQRGDDGPIKVGISVNAKKRLKTLQTGNAEKLKLLRVFTMRDVEKAIHGELEREARLHGEWFPAELLPNILRFFSVPEDIQSKRLWKRHSVRQDALQKLAELLPRS